MHATVEKKKGFLEVFAAILPQTVVRGEFRGELRFEEWLSSSLDP